MASVHNILRRVCEHCGKPHTGEYRTKLVACYRWGSVDHFVCNCLRIAGKMMIEVINQCLHLKRVNILVRVAMQVQIAAVLKIQLSDLKLEHWHELTLFELKRK